MNIQVLYGTETGNAEMVADDIVDALSADVSIESTDMSKFSVTDLSPDVFYFIVCSTYGDGELPHSTVNNPTSAVSSSRCLAWVTASTKPSTAAARSLHRR